jgi:lipopolysaccharide/colanic/teichoic acid biosynthesis glycosyltransferase
MQLHKVGLDFGETSRSARTSDSSVMPNLGRHIETEDRFRRSVAQEWRRAERSNKPALLLLLEGLECLSNSHADMLAEEVGSIFRDTDIVGWFEVGRALGVICVELGNATIDEARSAIVAKLQARFPGLSGPGSDQFRIVIHVLPPFTSSDGWDSSELGFAKCVWNSIPHDSRGNRILKRSLDVVGSALLLLIFLPFLLAIALAVKFSSQGPALYRQMRAGLGGRSFALYKFRSMRSGANSLVHMEYVKRFIGGTAEQHLDARGEPIYKLTHDPRVTPLGRFLRRTSLDELPQLWNVFLGDMSLVGPRPPLVYEVENYKLWHRRRVFEVKPGLTGLWQVRGRNRCSFDDMIRLDLQHAGPDSLPLYLKVLWETPRAVITGGGAH